MRKVISPPVATTLILILAFSWSGTSVSEASEAPPSDVSRKSLVRLADAMPIPGVDSTTITSMATWTMPERRWGFFLRGKGGNASNFLQPDNASAVGFNRIVRFDLDTGSLLGEAAVSPHINLGAYRSRNTVGTPEVMDVDPHRGRLFAAYQLPGPVQFSPEQPCAATMRQATSGPQCFAGLVTIDAESLTVTNQRAFDLRRLDAPMLAPGLMALNYVAEAGVDGKVLVLVSEMANDLTAAGIWISATSPRKRLAQLTYLVQFDAQTLTQEWAVRVDACRGDRGVHEMSIYRANPAAIIYAGQAQQPAIYVACQVNSSLTAGVVRIPLDRHGEPDPLPVAVDEAQAGDVRADGGLPVRAARGQVAVTGPEDTFELLADNVSGRMFALVSGSVPLTNVWWVFDTAQMRWIGTIGVGASASYHNVEVGLDTRAGRLYALIWPAPDAQPGLYSADVRGTPLAQTLRFFDPWPSGLPSSTPRQYFPLPLSIDSGTAERPARILVNDAPSDSPVHTKWWVIEDHMPAAEPVAGDISPFEGRTLDLTEREGATAAVIDGAARGYGVRAILMGGLDAVARLGPIDGPTQLYHVRDAQSSYYTHVGQTDVREASGLRPLMTSPCREADRAIVFAFVGNSGPAVVDGAGSRGSAVPVEVDASTRSDFEASASRCTPGDWEQTWKTALVGRPPASEPALPWLTGDEPAECASGDGEPASRASVGDALLGTFAAQVVCDDEQANGFGYARLSHVGGLGVAESLSSFRIYRDPGRGIVARVESVARGVDVDGALRIDTVRGVAESWANGRRQPVEATGGGGSNDPNCDFERTAGTCFQRHVFGLWTPGYQCGPCGDESQVEERVNRMFVGHLTVRLRMPDERLAAGAPNGYTAAVQKPDDDRFADLVLNNDLLQTTLPSLEIIRYAPPGPKPPDATSPSRPRGRQIYQLAGVEVSSSYGIQCLLVYDEESNTCAPAAEEPGSIVVSLQDSDGEPMAGGGFEVRRDVDADGVLGLVDSLVADGACLTAEDGVGTCRFENLQPGSYLVSQVAAPPGYAKTDGPWLSDLSSGEQRTVVFTNVSNVSTIELSAEDADGRPLSGAVFVAYPDPDADGEVAAGTQPVASCATDADGMCVMRVPTGSYVLLQTVTPGGLAPMEPVAFAFVSGGQTAAVGVVNYALQGVSETPPAAAPPVVYTDRPAVAPSEVVSAEPPPVVVRPPAASLPEQLGGTITRVIRTPGDALRLLSRDPVEALAWAAALVLLALALLAVRRRVLLGTLTSAPAVTGFARVGWGGPSAGPSPADPAPWPRGSGRPPAATRPSSGGAGPRSRGVAARPVAVPASRPGRRSTATGVLERPVVAGSAPNPTEGPVIEVVAATASYPLAAVVRERLAASGSGVLLRLVETADQLRALLVSVRPDVLVVDLTLSTGGPQDVCDLLADLHPAERIVGLIPPNRSHEALAMRGLAAGLSGILVAPDDLGNGHLAYAIRCVAAGKPCYGPTVQAILLKERARAPKSRERSSGLTSRELEVAQLVARGATRSEIAKLLYLSPGTVKWHLRAVRAKLGVTNPWDRAQVRLRLEEAGLLDESEEA